MAMKLSKHVFLPLLVVAIAEFVPVVAHPHTTSSTSAVFQRAASSDNSGSVDCTTQFSGDYYGFGVRLGVYFTWLGSYAANVVLPSEIAGALDTNAIFLLALLISLFRGSVTNDLYQLDGLITMQLSSGFIFSSLSIWGYRTVHYQKSGRQGILEFGGFGTHFRLALTTAISIYGTWFWWEGVDDGLKAAEDERCRKVYTWLFHPWQVDKGVNILYVVICLGCSIYYGLMCVAAIIATVAKLLRIRHTAKVRFETGLNIQELNVLFTIFSVWNLVWIIFCALMIELTLNDNHAIGVLAKTGAIGTPAQLIPSIIGVMSFLRILYLIYKESKRDAERLAAESDQPPLTFMQTVKKIVTPSLRWGPPAGTDYDRTSTNHPWHLRYLISWLPWLSTFAFWRRPASSSVDMTPVTPKPDEKDGFGTHVSGYKS